MKQMKKMTKYTQRGVSKNPGQKKDGVEREFLKYEKYKHYDQDLETAVLGICMLESDAMARIRRFLSPEMFYYEFHRSVYNAMAKLFDDGFPIDMLTVINHLHRYKDDHIQGLLDIGENVAWKVTALTYAVSQGTNLDYWAYLIREQFIERKLLELTTGGQRMDTGREELTRVQEEVNALLNFRVGGDDWIHISTLLVRLWQHMQEIAGKDIIGLPSGFKYFDKITSGITPGLYYLGARPSVGKTAFAIKMILNMASNEDPVGIISLETPGIKLAARLLAMVSGIDFWRIWRNKMSEERSKELYTYSGSAFRLPIWVSDEPAVNLTDIRAKAWNLWKRGAKSIFIDYLQLVNPDEGSGTREQEVAKLSRGLKLLSMQLNIPIIALAQLSRESERRTDKTPRLIDLRESGSLEQDADGVMLLHRPDKSSDPSDHFDEQGNSLKGKATLIVAKWRDGETFDHPLRFNGDRMEFSEDEIAIMEQRGWNGDDDQHSITIMHTPPPRDPSQPSYERDDPDDLPF